MNNIFKTIVAASLVALFSIGDIVAQEHPSEMQTPKTENAFSSLATLKDDIEYEYARAICTEMGAVSELAMKTRQNGDPKYRVTNRFESLGYPILIEKLTLIIAEDAYRWPLYSEKEKAISEFKKKVVGHCSNYLLY